MKINLTFLVKVKDVDCDYILARKLCLYRCIFVNTNFVAIQISSEIFVILQVASLRSYIEHKN